MRKSKAFIILLAAAAVAPHATAQQAVELKQEKMSTWDIGTANFSGIAPLGNDRYALVSDKEPADGFFIVTIEQDSATGTITHMEMDSWQGNANPKLDRYGMSVRDCEGIASFPAAGTVFISGEGDQEILEYSFDGQPTGRKLNVPTIFGIDRIVHNRGFEALSYSPETHRFWTITESTLKADGETAGPDAPTAQNLLRLQAFDDNLQPVAQFAYRMDKGRSEDFGKYYALGVPEVTALPNGRLLVLERELNITNGYMGSEVICKLFLVDPTQSWQIDSSVEMASVDPNHFMIKRLLLTFRTVLTPFKQTFANYEGMCLGATLADGRQTLLMVSDSQGGASRGPIQLKDWIKVIILPDDI